MSVGSHRVGPAVKYCPCVECWNRLWAEWERRYGPEVWPSHFHTLFGAAQVQHPQNVGAHPVPDKPQEPVTLAPKPLRCGKDPLVDAPRKVSYSEGCGRTHCDCTNCRNVTCSCGGGVKGEQHSPSCKAWPWTGEHAHGYNNSCECYSCCRYRDR